MQDRKRYRVAQCSTGGVGAAALPMVVDHPELELMAVWAHSPEKVGTDVGSLIGREPIGVQVTGDFDAIVSAEVDCVLYFSEVMARESEARKDLIRLLSAGKNVVVPWLSELHYPRAGARYAGDFIADVEAACTSGQSSVVMTGTCPGFCTGLLPAILTGISSSVSSIRAQEILDYSPHNDPRMTAPDVFCFGQPLEHDAPNFVSPEILRQAWGTTPALLAASLGHDLEETEFFEHRGAAVSRYEFPFGDVVEPGTIGARWFGLSGKVPGGPEIVFEHFTFVGDENNMPADWPVPRPVNPGYRVLIEGVPSLDLHISARIDGDDFWGAMAVTSAASANIVPAVCNAPSGIVDHFSLSVGDLTARRPPA